MLFVTMLKEQKKKLLSLYIFDTIADRFCAGTNKWLLFTHKNVDLAVISVTELGSVVDPGNGPGGACPPPPPVILRPNRGPKGRKIVF